MLVGAGRATYDFEDVRSSIDDTQYNAGIGVMRSLNDRFALRADFRGVSSNKVSGITPMAFVGLTGYFGKGGTPPPPPPDSDGDGVPNDQDQCPTTPA